MSPSGLPRASCPKSVRGLAAKRLHAKGVAKVETNLEQCPLCGSDLSQTKFREIRAKLRDQEQKKTAELAEAKMEITRALEGELKKEFERQKQAAERKAKEEAD